MKDFPLIRSPRAVLIGSAAVAVPVLLFAFTMMGWMYVPMMVIFLVPAALCLVAAVCGSLATLAGEAAALAAMGWLFGARGAMLTALYTAPILMAFAWIVIRRVDFKKGCFALIGVHLAALALCFMLLRGWAGGDIYGAAAEAASRALDQWDLGDLLLYELYMFGLIDLPQTLQETALVPTLDGLGMALSDAARSDLLLSLTVRVRSVLFSLVPSVIVSQSILGGVCCLVMPLRFGFIAQERRAFKAAAPMPQPAEGDAPPHPPVDFPTLNMPPFHTWHLPRGMGLQAGLALIAGYFLQNNANPALCIAGIILYAAARTLFTVQGASFINFLQKQRNRRRVWRVIVPAALMLTPVPIFAGVFDQIVNIRGLRAPRQPKEE